jgi:hypothetical protein
LAGNSCSSAWDWTAKTATSATEARRVRIMEHLCMREKNNLLLRAADDGTITPD